MQSDRRTLEVTVTDALVEFIDRVHRREMENVGAYKHFPMGDEEENSGPEPLEKALRVLMSEHKSVLFDVRQDRGLLDDEDVDEEFNSVTTASLVPDDWDPSRNVLVARIRTDE